MYEIVSQAFVILFLTAYSVLLIALAWWALKVHLGHAVKNGLWSALVRVVGRLHSPLGRLKSKASDRGGAGGSVSMRATAYVPIDSEWYWLQIGATLAALEQFGADSQDVESMRLIVSRKLRALEWAQVN